MEDDNYAMREPAGCSPLSCVLSFMFPCSLFGACYSVQEGSHAVELRWGRFSKQVTDPGIQCSLPCGRSVLMTSTKQISHDLVNVKVVDARGNPLLISGVVRYRFQNTVRTLLEVERPNQYVELLALATLKTICSRFPYESSDSNVPCLKTEASVISDELVRELQEKAGASGAQIISLSLNEISYAPEISQTMLRKNAAAALVEARTTVVQGAVDVALEACDELEEKGHGISADSKGRIVSNLLTILTSDRDVTPVLMMNSN